MGIDYTKFTFTVYDDNHNIISVEKINTTNFNIL